MDINIQSNQSIIVHNQSRWNQPPEACNFTKKRLQHRCFPVKVAIFFDACLIIFSFLGWALKKRRNDGWVRSFVLWNPFWKGDLNFLHALKMITVISKLLIFFSHTHTHTQIYKFCFLFQDFLPNQTYIARISFWFLETQGSAVNFIYGLLLFSRAPKDGIDTSF